ncbi:hypothetical protein RRF57_008758 [Xylaria bambusicola]|uniref:Uncharacterized protein n=1 Tax=Xylaria bambusicola TaxID=326684 RepID=A0AAN7UYJ1_9PEZI
MQLSQGVSPFLFSHLILDLRHLVQAILERIGGRILGCLLPSLLATSGRISFIPYSPVFSSTASSLRSWVSDGSVSEYARVAGDDVLARVLDGEYDSASLGFGVAQPDVELKVSSNSWGLGGERIE